MLDTPLKIGIAPLFHNDTPLKSRISEKARLFVLAQSANWAEDICLFKLPEHLRIKWWSLADVNIQNQQNSKPGFSLFFDEFEVFAAYKNIPILPSSKLDVLIRLPGETYEMACNVKTNLRSVINLGDEQSYVVVGAEKVLLESGDGIWAPNNGRVSLADTLSKSDIEVLLLITE